MAHTYSIYPSIVGESERVCLVNGKFIVNFSHLKETYKPRFSLKSSFQWITLWIPIERADHSTLIPLLGLFVRIESQRIHLSSLSCFGLPTKERYGTVRSGNDKQSKR